MGVKSKMAKEEITEEEALTLARMVAPENWALEEAYKALEGKIREYSIRVSQRTTNGLFFGEKGHYLTIKETSPASNKDKLFEKFVTNPKLSEFYSSNYERLAKRKDELTQKSRAESIEGLRNLIQGGSQ